MLVLGVCAEQKGVDVGWMWVVLSGGLVSVMFLFLWLRCVLCVVLLLCYDVCVEVLYCDVYCVALLCCYVLCCCVQHNR